MPSSRWASFSSCAIQSAVQVVQPMAFRPNYKIIRFARIQRRRSIWQSVASPLGTSWPRSSGRNGRWRAYRPWLALDDRPDRWIHFHGFVRPSMVCSAAATATAPFSRRIIMHGPGRGGSNPGKITRLLATVPVCAEESADGRLPAVMRLHRPPADQSPTQKAAIEREQKGEESGGCGGQLTSFMATSTSPRQRQSAPTSAAKEPPTRTH
jgi:hypothetical protein